MSEQRISLVKWIENYDAGAYDAPDGMLQIKAGWYDWFCKDERLASRLKRLAPKVKKIAKSSKINPETTYVWFKNNCPMIGSLYDDFRIADLTTGNTLYCVIPSSGHNIKKGQSEVWGPANNFDGPLVAGSWADVLKFFGV
jgi:hypothetical protein